MRYANLYLICCLLALTVVLLQPACRKSETGPNGPQDDDDDSTTSVIHVDTLSNHLQFHGSIKKQGNAPTAPAGNAALKISFEDTLFLTDQVLKPIKFQHLDSTKDVAGVFLQVMGSNGSAASHYYDIPELDNMKESDTISIIMVGIDPAGLVLPIGGGVKIIPYDENHQPLGQVTRPLKVAPLKVDVPGTAGGNCGLTLPQGARWEWVASYIRPEPGSKIYPFWSDPAKVWNAEGQDIQGSCCNGISLYPEYCQGEIKPNRKLHFATFYQIQFESFIFYSGGTFFRHTQESSPVPLPTESDYCGNAEGKVKESVKYTQYEGNWSIHEARLPANAPFWAKNDSLELRLQTTLTTGTGFGNPGGIIHQLDCTTGQLVLVQLDREGTGKDLIKVYDVRKKGDRPWWYNFF